MRLAGEALAQSIQNPAEGMFAVRGSHTPVEIEAFLFYPLQLAVVRKGPVFTPQFAGKGVGILETDPAAIRLADMADHDVAFDRVMPQQVGDLGASAGIRIVKAAAAMPLVKGDPPAVLVGSRHTTALHQTGETEADVSGDICAHTE